MRRRQERTVRVRRQTGLRTTWRRSVRRRHLLLSPVRLFQASLLPLRPTFIKLVLSVLINIANEAAAVRGG